MNNNQINGLISLRRRLVHAAAATNNRKQQQPRFLQDCLRPERLAVYVVTLLSLVIFSLHYHISLDEPLLLLQQQQQQQSKLMSRQLRETKQNLGRPPLLCPGPHVNRFALASKESKIDLSNQRRFVQNGGYEQIAKGSGNIHAAGPLLQTLSHVQQDQLNIFGSVGELGVHHGRFTGFLYMTARKTEPLVAIDLFETLQHVNIDLSGMGDRKKFIQGMKLYGLQETDLTQLLSTSTLDLQINGLDWWDKNRYPGFRLWSIDAGHTAELTRHDLQLTFCNLVPGGIVVLDDWFHPHWPGVVEGFYQFVTLDSPRIGTTTTTGRQNKQDRTKKDRRDGDIAVGDDIGIYPFLLCEGKLYVTNDRQAYNVYIQTLMDDPILNQWVTLYAQVGHQRQRTWNYQMVNGTQYVRCDKSKLPKPKQAQTVWLERLEQMATVAAIGAPAKSSTVT